MPRARRPAHELTTDEALRRLFPTEVRETLGDEAKNSSKDEGNATIRPQSR
jgi:hypothetical protein